MKYSFIVLDLKGEVNASNLMQFFNKEYKNEEFEVIYCSSHKTNKRKNLKSFIFEKNENSEKIINAVTKECLGQNIIIVRNANAYEDVLKLTDNLQNSNEVVFYKKEQAKFKGHMLGIFKRIVAFMFMQCILPVKYGTVLYGEIPSLVLKKIESPAVLMKSNSWQGINYKLIDGGSDYKFEYNKVKHALKTIITLLVPIVMIVLNIFINFNMVPALYIIYYAVVVMMLLLGIINLCKWFISRLIGDTIRDSANFKS